MKVLVEFLTRQQADGETAETRFSATGLLDETERGLCLRYVEPPDEATEREGAAVRTTVCGTQLIVERQSTTVNSRMTLESGQCHPFRYDTLYGGLNLHVQCDVLENKLTARGGRLFARYRVNTPGAEAPATTLEITLKEVSE